MTTVYISIGNSDDKLTQLEWHCFWEDVDTGVRRLAERVYGAWVSSPTDQYQNACWAVEVSGKAEAEMRDQLRFEARTYKQDSIAWAVVPETEFLRPKEATS